VPGQTARGASIRLDAIGSIVKDPNAVLRGVDCPRLCPWKGQKKAARKVGHGFQKVFRDVGREGSIVAKLKTVDDRDESFLSSLQRRAQVRFEGAHDGIL
jgi:hypothetical protein